MVSTWAQLIELFHLTRGQMFLVVIPITPINIIPQIIRNHILFPCRLRCVNLATDWVVKYINFCHFVLKCVSVLCISLNCLLPAKLWSNISQKTQLWRLLANSSNQVNNKYMFRPIWWPSSGLQFLLQESIQHANNLRLMLKSQAS